MTTTTTTTVPRTAFLVLPGGRPKRDKGRHGGHKKRDVPRRTLSGWGLARCYRRPKEGRRDVRELNELAYA